MVGVGRVTAVVEDVPAVKFAVIVVFAVNVYGKVIAVPEEFFQLLNVYGVVLVAVNVLFDPKLSALDKVTV